MNCHVCLVMSCGKKGEAFAYCKHGINVYSMIHLKKCFLNVLLTSSGYLILYKLLNEQEALSCSGSL